MNHIKILLFICIIFGIAIPAMAQKNNASKSCTDIVEKNVTHIVRITKDSLVVITGSTYLFTVDTPADEGLVSTNTGVRQLLQQVQSKDGSRQTYNVTDKNGFEKIEGNVIAGDHLVVTSQNGKVNKIYGISSQPMAIGGQLRLEQDSATVSTNKNIVIYFTAGQRSPNTTVKIYLPEGVKRNRRQ